MASHQTGSKIRRSVVLSTTLVEEARRNAPPGLRDNLNRLVVVALEEYVRCRKRAGFEEAIARMARDPEVMAESSRIAEDFRPAEGDGLSDASAR
jgi:hypothetical protein